MVGWEFMRPFNIGAWERSPQTSQRPPIIHFYAERGLLAAFNLMIGLDERIIAPDVLKSSFTFP